jgi:hypothetical protein
MANHCLGTLHLVQHLNAEETRRETARAWSLPRGVRIRLGSSVAERGAIVRFLQAASLVDGDRVSNRNHASDWHDVADRVWAIARGIEEEQLEPEVALERLRTIARTTGEPLSSRLHGLVKGIRRGKHRSTSARVAMLPPPARVAPGTVSAERTTDDDIEGEIEAECEAEPLATPRRHVRGDA